MNKPTKSDKPDVSAPVQRAPRTPRSRSPHPDRHAQVDDLYPYEDRFDRDWEEERIIIRELEYMGIRTNDA
jgi:hypothetical protein